MRHAIGYVVLSCPVIEKEGKNLHNAGITRKTFSCIDFPDVAFIQSHTNVT